MIGLADITYMYLNRMYHDMSFWDICNLRGIYNSSWVEVDGQLLSWYLMKIL